MKTMAIWQRAIYNLGEALMLAGILWGLYRMFMLRSCPMGAFNDLTLITIGLAVSIIPLHPFASAGGTGLRAGREAVTGTEPRPADPSALPKRVMPAYLVPLLRRMPLLALNCWLLALAGAAVSLWARLSLQPGLWWLVGLIPPALYFWLGVTTRITEPLSPPAQAPPPAPPGESKEQRDA